MATWRRLREPGFDFKTGFESLQYRLQAILLNQFEFAGSGFCQ